MRVLRFFLIACAVLLVTFAIVLATLPAEIAWRFAAPKLPVLELHGIEGSLWQGRAAQARLAAHPVGALAWRVEAGPLLRGELRARIEISGATLQGEAHIARQRSGVIDVRNAHFQGSAAPLEQALDLGVTPVGTLVADVAHARITMSWFDALDARITWRDAGVRGAAEAAFGELGADFSLDSARRVHGVIRDSGTGPLEVAGDFLAQPSAYRLEARLAARDAEDWQTQEALSYLGDRQTDGSVLLRVEGHLIGVPLR